MHHFSYRDGILHAEGVNLAEVARNVGTPFYCYSSATLERHYEVLSKAFEDAGLDALICYAIKANSNQAVIKTLAGLGAGMDVVSEGELRRARAAGVPADKIIFAGVGKTREEMQRALELGIRCFNVESEAELERLNQLAGEMRKTAPVALRVNPDVDAKTHPYISTGLKENKFGIEINEAQRIYRRAHEMPNIHIAGIDCHIGSQLTELAPFLDALDRLLSLIDRLQKDNIPIEHLDLGGGLGVRYDDEHPPEPADYARAVAERLGDTSYEIYIEPGRAIAANAGVLLTRVEYLKPGETRNFAVIDAAMNDLIRPSLYQAWQAIVPVE